MFRFDVYHHFVPPVIPASLVERLDAIMTTQTELVTSLEAATAELATVTAVVGKISGETQMLLDRVAELQVAVENAGNLTPEVVAARDALQAQVEATKLAVQAVDAQVPDPV